MMNAIKLTDNNQTPSLVVGLGKTGWSVVRYLCDQNLPVVVTDSREIPPYLSEMREKYPNVAFLPGLSEQDFGQYTELVISPGVASTAKNAVGDIELFLREARAPVIAITGSNGKSTVTMLVTEVLCAGGYQVLTGGNIGTPALDLLSHPSPDFYVLELSSFQLETTHSLQALSSVVLNISEDHMDRYSGIEEYADAKKRIYINTRAAITNREDAVAKETTELNKEIKRLSFGLDRPGAEQFGIIKKDNKDFLAYGEYLLAPVSDVVMGGEQNLQNILAAFALVVGAGIEINNAMVSAATQYPGLPHRCEVVSRFLGVTWINDSKGTNVGATSAAISGAKKPLILIAGGQGKGADFKNLGDMIDACCKAVVLIGEDAEKIASTIQNKDLVHRAVGLEQSIITAAELANEGDTILFSPACASFDMFKSYEHRGDCFREIVLQFVREARDA